MDYKTSHKLFWGSAILGALLVLVNLATGMEWIGLVGLGVLAFCIVQVSLFYRCPHCGGGLPINWNLPERCIRCRRRVN